MNNQVKTLLESARQLSVEEREELAELILDTIDKASWQAAWSNEASRRVAEHIGSGEVATDGFAAIDEARRQLKRREG